MAIGLSLSAAVEVQHSRIMQHVGYHDYHPATGVKQLTLTG